MSNSTLFISQMNCFRLFNISRSCSIGVGRLVIDAHRARTTCRHTPSSNQLQEAEAPVVNFTNNYGVIVHILCNNASLYTHIDIWLTLDQTTNFQNPPYFVDPSHEKCFDSSFHGHRFDYSPSLTFVTAVVPVTHRFDLFHLSERNKLMRELQYGCPVEVVGRHYCLNMLQIMPPVHRPRSQLGLRLAMHEQHLQAGWDTFLARKIILLICCSSSIPTALRCNLPVIPKDSPCSNISRCPSLSKAPPSSTI